MIMLRMPFNRNTTISDTATTTFGGVTVVDIARLLRKEAVQKYINTASKRAEEDIKRAELEPEPEPSEPQEARR